MDEKRKLLNEVIYNLKNIKLFIYKINNKYYYISNSLFEECKNSEIIKEYDKFLGELNRYDSYPHPETIDSAKYEKLYEFYNNILKSVRDNEVNSENIKLTKEKMNDLLITLDIKELQSIIEQANKFRNSLKYIYKYEMFIERR